jgi:hypothetical protein
MFEIGQIVYIKNPVYGWFDRSLQRRIPENAACVVEKIYEVTNSYSVKFLGKWEEFGQLVVDFKDLKVDNG